MKTLFIVKKGEEIIYKKPRTLRQYIKIIDRKNIKMMPLLEGKIKLIPFRE
jgi:hypothetical protein